MTIIFRSWLFKKRGTQQNW